jgi:dynein heavy chain 1, cytosolic
LSSSEGNILENEKLIATLDTIKVDSKKIAEAIAESEKVMGEISGVTDVYRDIAYKSSRLFFSM